MYKDEHTLYMLLFLLTHSIVVIYLVFGLLLQNNLVNSMINEINFYLYHKEQIMNFIFIRMQQKYKHPYN
jgi:hypothetical protein